MTVFNFNPVPVWGSVGEFARIGAKASTTFPVTDEETGDPCTVTQEGNVQVGYVRTNDGRTIPQFSTTDVPVVVVDFGFAKLTISSPGAVRAAAQASIDAAASAASAQAAANLVGAPADSAIAAAITPGSGSASEGILNSTIAAAVAPKADQTDLVDLTGVATTEKTIYVSTGSKASDSNDGLSRAKPKSTLAAAVTALGSVGGVIELGQGTHTLTATLTVPSSVAIRGTGRNPTNGIPSKIDASAVPGSTPAIKFDGASECELSDFYLTGRTSATAPEIQTVNNCRGLTLKRLTVNSSTTGAAIDLGATGSVIRSKLEGVTVVGAATGIQVGGACTSIVLDHCYANACTSIGFTIKGTYIALIGCAADQNTLYGYNLQGCVAVSLVSCGAETNGRGAFHLSGAKQTALVTCRGVSNNTSANAAVASFADLNDASDYVTFIGCVDTTPNAASANSVKCWNGTAPTVVTFLGGDMSAKGIQAALPQFSVTTVTTTSAPAAGAAGALPATPAGYATVIVNGTARKFAYY